MVLSLQKMMSTTPAMVNKRIKAWTQKQLQQSGDLNTAVVKGIESQTVGPSTRVYDWLEVSKHSVVDGRGVKALREFKSGTPIIMCTGCVIYHGKEAEHAYCFMIEANFHISRLIAEE